LKIYLKVTAKQFPYMHPTVKNETTLNLVKHNFPAFKYIFELGETAGNRECCQEIKGIAYRPVLKCRVWLKLLSGFPFTVHGIPDNNLESFGVCTISFLLQISHFPFSLFYFLKCMIM
jgi:hypothetical protein